MTPLDLTDDERAFQSDQQGLAVDPDGNEILVGLTREESARFVVDSRTWFEQRHSATRRREDKERFVALSEKHEVARLRAIGLMNAKPQGTA